MLGAGPNATTTKQSVANGGKPFDLSDSRDVIASPDSRLDIIEDLNRAALDLYSPVNLGQ